MKTSIRVIRQIIREVILHEYGEPSEASGTDPKDAKGFYDYEIERGADIHGFWYKSPGRQQGSDGDPYRPADAAEFLGMKKPEEPSEETEGSGEEGAEGESAPEPMTSSETQSGDETQDAEIEELPQK